MKHAHHLPHNQNPLLDCSGEHQQQHPREYGGAVGWWGGVGAGAPGFKHVQQVFDVDATGDLYREDGGWCTLPTRCGPSNYYLSEMICAAWGISVSGNLGRQTKEME